VSAKDLGTGKEQKITITASSGLDKGEIDKMIKESDQYAADDQQRREKVETLNRADATVYETEKLLKEHSAKIDATKKAQVENVIQKLKQLVKDNAEAADLKKAMEELNTAMQAISAELYSQARGAGAPGAESQDAAAPQTPADDGEAKPGGDDVIDADFEMVDDKK
ncbi:MAG: Hsp70 family protein, partial [Lentisphaerae bacterium]|nr:Hsp70 family protein [Lentisphaerota bacterium]